VTPYARLRLAGPHLEVASCLIETTSSDSSAATERDIRAQPNPRRTRNATDTGSGRSIAGLRAAARRRARGYAKHQQLQLQRQRGSTLRTAAARNAVAAIATRMRVMRQSRNYAGLRKRQPSW
jgi:hypothetical protein